MFDEIDEPDCNYKLLAINRGLDLNNYRLLVMQLRKDICDQSDEIKRYREREKRYYTKRDKIETHLVKCWSESYHENHQN